MLKNIFIIAIRNARRNGIYTFLNVGGLALAMMSSLLIFLWVHNEWSVDQFHTNEYPVYLGMQERTNSEGDQYVGKDLQYLLGPTIIENVTGIRRMTRVLHQNVESLVMKGERKFTDNKLVFVDHDFFQMFDYPLVSGEYNSMFDQLHSVLISEEYAYKLFGDHSPIGKSITVRNWIFEKDFVVKGVISNSPNNSALQYDIIFPITILPTYLDWVENWGSTWIKTYFEVEHGADIDLLSNQMTTAYKANHEDAWFEVFLFPFKKEYLYNDFSNGRNPSGRIDYIRFFTVVGVIIILFGLINFINLSTANATKRVKEVGVRKVIGASRTVVMYQFLFESLVLCCIASILALTATQLLLPSFNEIVDTQLVIPVGEWWFAPCLLLVVLLFGMLAGIYPALFISGFSPFQMIKGSRLGSDRLGWLKRLSTLFQLIISSALILATVVIYLQMDYIQSRELGIQKEHRLYFQLNGAFDHQNKLKLGLLNSPAISSVAFIDQNPIKTYNTSGDPTWEGKDPDMFVHIGFIDCGYDIVETLGLQLVSGKSFSEERTSDTTGFIINEAMAGLIGVEDPVGLKMKFWDKEGRINGVVKNFHYKSMRDEIGPMILRLWPDNSGYAVVKIQPGASKQAIESIRATYSKYESEYPLSYHFLDDDFERLYSQEASISSLLRLFAFLAIAISVIGMYGIITFTVELKTKEIGIRKVLGASAIDIGVGLFRSFFYMILIAGIVGIPLSLYWIMEWLNAYAYRVELVWPVFISGILILTIISALTVGIKSVKSGMVNPVGLLRSE
ncbi:MAG: ABC transporter permease [Bacteroidota bacterium]